ncbi:MAG: SDR family oxidoreductase [Alphaproteobacteria bacterium]|nr:SDR family oxidoreductase [Alphaproteobacteria bacterium]
MLKNRTILITSVTHFTGIPASSYLGELGATVLCHDESFTDPIAREKFIAGKPGLIALAAQEPAAVVDEAITQAGHIDALVNNDAYPAIRAPIEEVKAEDMREGLEAMLVRPMMMSSAVVPHMKERGEGKIIFLTSATAQVGLPNYSMYVAARGGANSLGLSLAKELAKFNIQVNVIAPNFIKNPDYFPPELLEDEEAYAKITKNIPMGRLGEPDEVAATIAFYCSKGSDFITGNVLQIAGGWT